MKYIKILSFLAVCLSTNIFAEDADRLLNDLKEKYSKINDFSAGITQEGRNSVFTGKIYFKKGNKFHLDLKNFSIVSDGSTLWNYNKKENKVVINDADSEENSILSFNNLLEVYPSKCTLSSSNEGKYNILILTPISGSGLKFKQTRLWINSEDLVEKVFIEGKDGNITFRFSDYKLNQDLPDSRFTFSAPKGSSIIDLR